jgi:hypothetical protein
MLTNERHTVLLLLGVDLSAFKPYPAVYLPVLEGEDYGYHLAWRVWA